MASSAAAATQQCSDTSFQVVILAGGECKRMYPLTSAGTVKALLPVGNRPLISYPLRNLAEAGIKNCIVVSAAAAVAVTEPAHSQQQVAQQKL
jgi:dTDP-glucose pyrophosphorylase